VVAAGRAAQSGQSASAQLNRMPGDRQTLVYSGGERGRVHKHQDLHEPGERMSASLERAWALASRGRVEVRRDALCSYR
jgi:hypothetical protein